jgi:hypothetical protein
MCGGASAIDPQQERAFKEQPHPTPEQPEGECEGAHPWKAPARRAPSTSAVTSAAWRCAVPRSASRRRQCAGRPDSARPAPGHRTQRPHPTTAPNDRTQRPHPTTAPNDRTQRHMRERLHATPQKPRCGGFTRGSSSSVSTFMSAGGGYRQHAPSGWLRPRREEESPTLAVKSRAPSTRASTEHELPPCRHDHGCDSCRRRKRNPSGVCPPPHHHHHHHTHTHIRTRAHTHGAGAQSEAEALPPFGRGAEQLGSGASRRRVRTRAGYDAGW